jgi:hypothetical protein
LLCFASYLATPRNDDAHNIFRHCERSEAIHGAEHQWIASGFALAMTRKDDGETHFLDSLRFPASFFSLFVLSDTA